MIDIIRQLTNEFNLKTSQVQNAVKLMDDGCTVPFIARYRKEMTGELNDQVLRELSERLTYLRNLEQRREEVFKSISEQDKMTAELEAELNKCVTLQEIEDIYAPYRPKRRTRATIAKEKGLEPLAQAIFLQQPVKGGIEEYAATFINAEKEVNTVEDALNGAMDIIAEQISDTPIVRQITRNHLFRNGMISTKSKKEEDSVYEMYRDFREPVARIPSYRVLAINRGEKEEFLQVKIEIEKDTLLHELSNVTVKNPPSETTNYVKSALEDALDRLILPAAEREIRNSLTENSEENAIKVFAANL
jgi:uncharacterized protein